ncbi:MAG TPA: hypothetical protein VFQ61_04860 [Polyangiaceae bacterium]|nr:hypothetical protein [Polyangiaceae bacterium]
MKTSTLALSSFSVLACSMDWSLARENSAGAGGSVDPGLMSAALLCDRIPPLASEPIIDGKLDSGLSLYSWIDETTSDSNAGVRADLSLAYRSDGLYFFVAVTDPTRDPAPLDALAYCGDGVELYVDDDGTIRSPPAYDRPGTMQFVVAAPSSETAAVRRGQRFVSPGSGDGVDLGAWASTRFTAAPTPSGYAVEAFIVSNDLDLPSWALASGAEIGWNLSLNIGGPEEPGLDVCTTRTRQVHFRFANSGTCTAPYCNASALCATALQSP